MLVGVQAEAAMSRGEKPVFGEKSKVSSGKQYRSAKNLVRKKVKIPESGIW
jgi:hypothetical protein